MPIARAGEVRKCFAVVAAELCELAQSVHEEATKISPYADEIESTLEKISQVIRKNTDFSEDWRSLKTVLRSNLMN